MATGIIELRANDRGKPEEASLFEGRILWESQLFTTLDDKAQYGVRLTLNFQVRKDGAQNASTYAGYFIICDNKTDNVVISQVDWSPEVSVVVGDEWKNVYRCTGTILYPSKSYAPEFYIDSWFWSYINETEFWTDNVNNKQLVLPDVFTVPATITAADNFTDEDNPTIYYNNPLGSRVESLQACIAEAVSGIEIYVPYRNISKTGSGYTFELTEAERATLRSKVAKDTLQVRFYVKTVVNGETHLSSIPKTLSLVDGEPVLNPTIEDINEATAKLTGGGSRFIRGHNRMAYNFNATAQKGATIVSYSVICGGRRGNSATGTLIDIENNVVHFSVTDSRGKTTTSIIYLDAVDYTRVTCKQTVRMLKEGETSTNAQIHLEVTGNFDDKFFGAKQNALTIEVRHTQNDGTLGDWADITPVINEIKDGIYLLTADITGFDVSGTYEFQTRAKDLLTEATTEPYTVTFTPVFDWSAHDFNFNVPLTIEGFPLVDYIVEQYEEPMGTNGTWFCTKWKSGKAECYGKRNFGTMAITRAWGGLYRSEHFTQSLPEGLFAFPPFVCDISCQYGTNGAWVAMYEGSGATADETQSFIVVRPASATPSEMHLGFNVIGRWKY